jgi:hypothetical protein
VPTAEAAPVAGYSTEVLVGRGGRRARWQQAILRLRTAAARTSPRSRWLIPLITALVVLAVAGSVQYLLTHGDDESQLPAEAKSLPTAATTTRQSTTPPAPSTSPPEVQTSPDLNDNDKPGSTKRTRGVPPRRLVPALVGLSAADAKTALARAGFTRTAKTRNRPTDVIGAGRVIDTDPTEGTSWAVDTPITLFVSAPMPPITESPKVESTPSGP